MTPASLTLPSRACFVLVVVNGYGISTPRVGFRMCLVARSSYWWDINPLMSIEHSPNAICLTSETNICMEYHDILMKMTLKGLYFRTGNKPLFEWIASINGQIAVFTGKYPLLALNGMHSSLEATPVGHVWHVASLGWPYVRGTFYIL
jgi:hypothetical protein